MPATGAGWVNLNEWLGLNQAAGAEQQKRAVAQANANAAQAGNANNAPALYGREKTSKGAGAAWSPEQVQQLVHGSSWDAALAGAQQPVTGQLSQPKMVGELGGEVARGNRGPAMTKWTPAQTQGEDVSAPAAPAPTAGSQSVTPPTSYQTIGNAQVQGGQAKLSADYGNGWNDFWKWLMGG